MSERALNICAEFSTCFNSCSKTILNILSEIYYIPKYINNDIYITLYL